jgi:hypothetical protein
MKRHIKTNKENELITVSVFYDKGLKTFYASIYTSILDGDYLKSLCWSGVKIALETVKRYSEKKETELVIKISECNYYFIKEQLETVAKSRGVEVLNPIQIL